jgi:flavorubredoxin
MITNAQSGTRVDEVAPSIYRISTPVSVVPGGFSFNQYLIVDEDPLLFHTGPRRMFPLVREAIAAVMPVEKLRWVGFSHVEADECGALNDLLAAAPTAQALCSQVAAMVSVEDLADRPPRALADGETVGLGRARVRWLDAPHLPHAWECGYLFEESTGTLLCGDLFTQPGATHPPVTEGDILGPSEAMRAAMDYYAHSAATRPLLEKLAATRPRTLACMHGSAWSGDGGRLLLDLAESLVPSGLTGRADSPAFHEVSHAAALGAA